MLILHIVHSDDSILSVFYANRFCAGKFEHYLMLTMQWPLPSYNVIYTTCDALSQFPIHVLQHSNMSVYAHRALPSNLGLASPVLVGKRWPPCASKAGPNHPVSLHHFPPTILINALVQHRLAPRQSAVSSQTLLHLTLGLTSCSCLPSSLPHSPASASTSTPIHHGPTRRPHLTRRQPEAWSHRLRPLC